MASSAGILIASTRRELVAAFLLIQMLSSPLAPRAPRAYGGQ